MRIDRPADGSIYHFTTAATFITYISPFGRLRFSPFKASMDPRERIPLNLGLGIRNGAELDKQLPDGEDPVGNKFLEISEVANSIARQKVQMLCFTNSYEPLHEGFQMDTDGDRGWAQAAMWTHFGGRSSGVCLEIDREKFLEDLEQATAGKVSILSGDVHYSDSGDRAKYLANLEVDSINDVTKEGIYGHLVQNSTAAFFTKDSNWSYEDEFRVVALTSCGEYVFAPLLRSLKRIILGDGVDPSVVEAIRWILFRSGMNVNVDRMIWHSTATFSPYRLERELEGDGLSTPPVTSFALQPEGEHEHACACLPTIQFPTAHDGLREALWGEQFRQQLRTIAKDASLVASEYELDFSSKSGMWSTIGDPDSTPARITMLRFVDSHTREELHIEILLERLGNSQVVTFVTELSGVKITESNWTIADGGPDQLRRDTLQKVAQEVAQSIRHYIQLIRKVAH